MEIPERLIVGADFDPIHYGGIEAVYLKVMELAKNIEGSGVLIKVNSILRARGYSLINELHELGLKVFADLKLIDISNTLKNDAAMLAEARPEIVTVMCCAGIDAMNALKK